MQAGPSLPRGLPRRASSSCCSTAPRRWRALPRSAGGAPSASWSSRPSTASTAAAAPISLADAVTYVWLGQALLALQPWIADPEIGQAVRTGGVGYDRLRPLDAYGYWYARTVGWMLARALPRAVLMVLAAGIVLPLVGLEDWAWRPPSGVTAALLFVPAFVLMTMLGGRRPDAGEHHRGREPQRARGQRRPDAAGDRLLRHPAAARLLSRRAAALPARAAARRPGRHPVPHLLRRPHGRRGPAGPGPAGGLDRWC